MRQKSYLLILILAAAGGCFGGAAINRAFSASSARARQRPPRAEASAAVENVEAPVEVTAQREPARADARRWEYCAITRAGQAPSIRRSAYAVTYFQPGGVRVVDVDESFSDRAALPRAIAKLGEEGWELVGEGPLEFKLGAGGEALYFKRRKP